MLALLSSLIVGALPLLFALWLGRRARIARGVRGRSMALLTCAGLGLGLVAMYAERMLFEALDLSLRVSHTGALGALLALFLFAAPFEEALKVLVVWPLYRGHRISSASLGVIYSVAVAAGFAAAESASFLYASADALSIFRALLGIPAQLFFAGVWGYALGSGKHGRGLWFSVAWLTSVLLHGLYDHIVFGRGPGFLIAVLPLLIAMAAGTWSALREVAPSSEPGSRRSTLLATLPEPPSLRAMREALRPANRPLMLHWVALGALVTLGTMIVLVAGAVYLGREVGVDFAMADESDMRSTGPLMLLGTAVLAAFPFAGFLVTRASRASSVVEAALAAGLAIALLLLTVSVTAPVGVVFALAVAPAAFGLACGGAWFGLGR